MSLINFVMCRISLVSLLSLPLGLGMLGVGGTSLASCSAQNVSQMEIASMDRDKSQAKLTLVRHEISLQLLPLQHP